MFIMLIIEHAKSEMEKGLRPKTKREKLKAFKEMPFEFHHILKSIFPKWSKRGTNLVALTSREHFFLSPTSCKNLSLLADVV